MNEYRFDDLRIGMECEFNHKVKKDHLDMFYELSGDNNPLHRDDEFAKSQGFEKIVVYGMLTASLISTLGGVYLPGKYCLIQGVEIQFVKPVYPDDEITVQGKIVELFESIRQAVIRIDMVNQDGMKILRGKLTVGVMDE